MSAVPGGIVVFDYGLFAMRYPELAGSINATLAQQFFNEAQTYCDNTPCSPIPYCPPYQTERQTLLNMMTAHIIALNVPLNGNASSPLVGRIDSATEGSVTVHADMPNQPGAAAWYQQTKYGAAFWTATAKYRQMLYAPGPVRDFEPYVYGGYRGY